MLDLKLPWKKVKVGGPIDFGQWQLSEQVRGMHMAVDKEGDIIAVPVFNVDPTLPRLVAASQPTSMNPWVVDLVVNTIATPTLRTQTTGSQVMGFSIEPVGPTLAVAQPVTFTIRLGVLDGLPLEFNPTIWIPANPADGQTKTWYFMPPIKVGPGLAFVDFPATLTAGFVHIHMWGLEP